MRTVIPFLVEVGWIMNGTPALLLEACMIIAHNFEAYLAALILAMIG